MEFEVDRGKSNPSERHSLGGSRGRQGKLSECESSVIHVRE